MRKDNFLNRMNVSMGIKYRQDKNELILFLMVCIVRLEFVEYMNAYFHFFIWNTGLVQDCTQSPGSNTPQDTNCTATCPLSRKLFKLGEPDMQDIAGEAEINS